MNRLRIRLLLTAASVLTAVSLLDGFAVISPQRLWANGTITMHLQLGSGSGTLIDGATSWGSVMEGALSTWNQHISRVAFGVMRDSTVAKGDGTGTNNVFFSDTIFGESFGDSTLAVATGWSRAGVKVESDILFNPAFSWNSYRGSLRSGIQDFGRVAIHEAGHTLGLDHPDEHSQSVSAIMNAFVSSLDTVTSDDISGAQSLYGAAGLSAPGAPTSLTAASSGSSITLTWSAPTTGGTPSAYTIEAGSSSGSANLASFSTGSTATTFSSTGVASGSYFVRVKATNAGGTSSASNEAVLTVGGGACTAAPGAPGTLTLVTNASGTVGLSWTAASGSPTTYLVEAGSATGLANLVPGTDLGGTATSFTATGVARGTYFVRMRAKNTCGTGAASNEVVITVS